VEATSLSTLVLWNTTVKLPNHRRTAGRGAIRAANGRLPRRQTAAYRIPGALRRRPGGPGFHVAEHRLFQLRIHFVCDGHTSSSTLLKSTARRLFCRVLKMLTCRIRDSSTTIATVDEDETAFDLSGRVEQGSDTSR
jgi:hypothetical protein